MFKPTAPDQSNVAELNIRQLQVYARELQQHVRRQRQTSEDLARVNGQLKQKIRELAALNRLVQEHLSQRFVVMEAYRLLLSVRGIQRQDTDVFEDPARLQPSLDPDAPMDYDAGQRLP